jgi:hypothetical protein
VPKAYTSLDAVLRGLRDRCRRPGHSATPALQQIQQVLAAGKHGHLRKAAVASLKHVDTLIEAERSSAKRILPIFHIATARPAEAEVPPQP